MQYTKQPWFTTMTKAVLVFFVLAVVLVAMSLPAAADTIEIRQTESPRMCVSPKGPVPCAFLIAMINRMQSRCGSGCETQQTCALKEKK